jgi:hypothetical protein
LAARSKIILAQRTAGHFPPDSGFDCELEYRRPGMDWSDSQMQDFGLKTYEIKQLDSEGDTVSSFNVDAASGEAAAKQLKQVAEGAESIKVCLDGKVMNEMGVDYWLKRVRRR